MAPETRPYVGGAPVLEPAFQSGLESAPQIASGDAVAGQEPLAAADATVE
jgi:hypothetical protein